jgi:hypothetical protein
MKIELIKAWTPPHETVYPSVRSLFGKLPFSEEQRLIVGFIGDVSHGVIPIIPEETAPHAIEIIERLSKRKRYITAMNWLWKARKKLEEMGV